MKRHFMESDMAIYFPKRLPASVATDFIVDGKPLRFTMRECPWIVEYWTRKYRESDQRGIPVRVLSTDAMIMQNAAIREKKPPEECSGGTQ